MVLELIDMLTEIYSSTYTVSELYRDKQDIRPDSLIYEMGLAPLLF